MRLSVSLITFALLAPISIAQNTPSDAGQPAKARVFITDSKSWEMVGGGGGSSSGFGGATRGGARPQTAEIIKTFGERCPDVVVNNKQEKADYIVLLDHEGGKGLILHDNKVAVFNKEGDSIVSHSTRSLGNAVKDACVPEQTLRLMAASWGTHHLRWAQQRGSIRLYSRSEGSALGEKNFDLRGPHKIGRRTGATEVVFLA